MKILILCLSLLSINTLALSERYYNKEFCYHIQGKSNVYVSPSFIDCVTKDTVWEMDIAKSSSKVYESIGQALYYSTLLPNKKPGVVLVLTDEKQVRYLRILYKVKHKYNQLGIELNTYIIKDF
jgi:hypothetical protein